LEWQVALASEVEVRQLQARVGPSQDVEVVVHQVVLASKVETA
jgi:hypothetical protein